MPEPEMRSPGLPEGYDAAVEAKRLLRSIRWGALATRGVDGFPFSSLVNVATAADGSPILLLSGLSSHTKNLITDPRVSLLLMEQGKGDPLAHPRLTIVGQASCISDEDRREQLKIRFLSRHPKSALYADFGDFSFWILTPERFNLNGGFARAAEFDPPLILTSTGNTQELEKLEAEALDHMNSDHKEALQLYAAALLGCKKAPWRASGIDPEGLDLIAGDLTARLPFPRPVFDGNGLRTVLAELADEARRKSK